jgi:hypothetical protein
MPGEVTAPLDQMLSWLLWGGELVLLAVLVTVGARIWIERRNPEIQGRHAGSAVVVTLIATAIASVAMPIAAATLGG